MTKNPLFSPYRQGENRVTSSMLAVFERIDLSLLESILAAAAGESSLQMVTFVNQPPGQGGSVPDARITARFAYWFEVKTERNALRTHQLQEHLACLTGEGDERLFVVTPDGGQPSEIADVGDPRVIWFSFKDLDTAIDAVLEDRAELVADQARFLLRELRALLVGDGLLDNDDTVVVAARSAYREYFTLGAYVCQPGRSFRPGLRYLGFYEGGHIRPELPVIEDVHDDLVFTPELVAQLRAVGEDTSARLADIVDSCLATGPRAEGETFKVILLTAPGDPRTVRLDHPIRNDTVSRSGGRWAWTLGQRYVASERLKDPTAQVTSDLAK